MTKFHISKDGVARKCEAETPATCRAALTEFDQHYETAAEAQHAYEEKMSKVSAFSSLKTANSLHNKNYKKYSTFGKTFKNVSGSISDVKNNTVSALKAFAKGGYIPKNTKIVSLSKNDANAVEAHLTGLDDKSIANFVNNSRADGKKKPQSMNMARKGVLAVASLAMVSGLAACGEVSNGSQDSDGNYIPSTAGVEQTLDSANEISLKKDAISWGDHWEVYADGEHVADIDGETIPTFGDTYVMTDLSGDMVGFETEDFLKLNRGADVYDENSESSGRIEQSIISIGYKFKIYDGETHVGTTQQNLGLSLSADVEDTDGNVEYKIDKALFSFGSSVTVVPMEGQDDRQVDAVDAVWNAVIMSEISDADTASSGNK